MSTKRIPEEVQGRVAEIVANFNREVLKGQEQLYVPRYRGGYLYLDRIDYGTKGPICRLEYTGDMEGWEFAIYKFSDGRYDPDEWFFPGVEYVDGTVEGAMRAGLAAYP